jgi:hypothetical protein
MGSEEGNFVIEYIDSTFDPDKSVSFAFIFIGIFLFGVTVYVILFGDHLNLGIIVGPLLGLFFLILAEVFWPYTSRKITINRSTITFNTITFLPLPTRTISIDFQDITLVKLKIGKIQIESKNRKMLTINTNGFRSDDRKRLVEFFKKKGFKITDQQALIKMLIEVIW